MLNYAILVSLAPMV